MWRRKARRCGEGRGVRGVRRVGRVRKVGPTSDGHIPAGSTTLNSCMRHAGDLFAGAIALVLCGCASGPMSDPYHACATCPTAVTPPTALAEIVSITILPNISEMKVADTVVFSVQVELSPGIPPSGPFPFWRIDNPAVAAVEGNRVTALAPGRVTLRVLFRGASATRLLKIVPNPL